ncbi:MAG: hypothetical protein PVJ86_07470 [Phycisphaerales bacterium]|jgi:hypothetical protein
MTVAEMSQHECLKEKFYSSDFNTTSFNWWMETAAKGGQAKPETSNATSFNWWFFTITGILATLQ